MSDKDISELVRKLQAGEELHIVEKARLARNRHELPDELLQQLVQQMESETYRQPDAKWDSLSKSQRRRLSRKLKKQKQAE